MAAATTATDALRHELEHPAAAMHALGVLQDVKARLEAWAAAQPPGRTVDDLERQRAADRIAKASADSSRLAAWMASVVPCGHRSCLPGACVYAR